MHTNYVMQVALKAMEGLECLRLHPSTFHFLVHHLEVCSPNFFFEKKMVLRKKKWCTWCVTLLLETLQGCGIWCVRENVWAHVQTLCAAVRATVYAVRRSGCP